MHRQLSRRCVQNGRLPSLTRRAAHSGLVHFPHRGDYQRGLITLQFSRPLPSKNTQLWSLVRTRPRFYRRPFRLALARKVVLPPPRLSVPSLRYTSFQESVQIPLVFPTQGLIWNDPARRPPRPHERGISCRPVRRPTGIRRADPRARQTPPNPIQARRPCPLTQPLRFPNATQEPTGSIEVSVQEFTVLNPADRNLPFSPSSVGRNLVSVLPTSSCPAINTSFSFCW